MLNFSKIGLKVGLWGKLRPRKVQSKSLKKNKTKNKPLVWMKPRKKKFRKKCKP